MKYVLLDLGNTLETQDVLRPGAQELLDALQAWRNEDPRPLDFALVSDWHTASTPEELLQRQQEYYEILDIIGIRAAFEPVMTRVTLSTEVNETKPHRRVFETAVERLDPDGSLDRALFVTENQSHVEAARALGMTAYHYQGPGQNTGDIDDLAALVPIIEEFVKGG